MQPDVMSAPKPARTGSDAGAASLYDLDGVMCRLANDLTGCHHQAERDRPTGVRRGAYILHERTAHLSDVVHTGTEPPNQRVDR